MKKLKFAQIFFSLLLYLTEIFFVAEAQAHHANKKMLENNPNGPWIYELISKKSKSYKFNKNGKSIIVGGHVPTLTEKKEKIYLYYQWFPKNNDNWEWFDHIGVSTTSDFGSTWSKPTGIKILNVPKRVFGRRTRPMDPCAVTLSDGRIRVYFTLEPLGPHFKLLGDAQIHSAISDDGINFVYEPGVRLAISDVDLRDPAVVYFKDQWHLYVPNQKNKGDGYYAISSDGINFTRKNDVKIGKKGNWLGNATVYKDQINFFGTVWRATSNNGIDWNTGRSTLGPDPAIIYLKNKTWFAVTFRKLY